MDIFLTIMFLLLCGSIFLFYRNHWTYKNIMIILDEVRAILDKISIIIDDGGKILHDKTIPHEEIMEKFYKNNKEYKEERKKYEEKQKEYESLPSYKTIFFKFWIWDIEKFKEY